jgi:hypothetical protein
MNNPMKIKSIKNPFEKGSKSPTSEATDKVTSAVNSKKVFKK